MTPNPTRGRSMGSHHLPNRGKSDDWLTPPELVEALGPFDLDPCASPDQPWATASVQWVRDGLDSRWHGLAWVNPPYSEQWIWMGRLADHGNGIALVFARTETDGFFRNVWDRASALFFLRGRLHFRHPKTGGRAPFNAGAPSVLVGYGEVARDRLRGCPLPGKFVRI